MATKPLWLLRIQWNEYGTPSITRAWPYQHSSYVHLQPLTPSTPPPQGPIPSPSLPSLNPNPRLSPLDPIPHLPRRIDKLHLPFHPHLSSPPFPLLPLPTLFSLIIITIFIFAAAPIVLIRLGGGYGVPFFGFVDQAQGHRGEGEDAADDTFEGIDVDEEWEGESVGFWVWVCGGGGVEGEGAEVGAEGDGGEFLFGGVISRLLLGLIVGSPLLALYALRLAECGAEMGPLRVLG